MRPLPCPCQAGRQRTGRQASSATSSEHLLLARAQEEWAGSKTTMRMLNRLRGIEAAGLRAESGRKPNLKVMQGPVGQKRLALQTGLLAEGHGGVTSQ